MEKVNNFFEKLDDVLLTSFYELAEYAGSLAPIYNRQTQSWAVEITRDVAVSLLNSITKLAVVNGLSITVDTTVDGSGNRFIAKCSLSIYDGGQQLLSFSAFGEGAETMTVQRTGEIIQNENAVRASETRAIKRVIEMLSPIIGRQLRYISQQLQSRLATLSGTITQQVVNNELIVIVKQLKTAYFARRQQVQPQQQQQQAQPQAASQPQSQPQPAQPQYQPAPQPAPAQTHTNGERKKLVKSYKYQPQQVEELQQKEQDETATYQPIADDEEIPF